jgi:hypothetical protein
MQPGLYDIYVLSHERSTSALNHFLARFAPRREAAADDYTVNDTALGSVHTFDCITTALDYCFSHPGASASFYWNCDSASPANAMAFFTEDGGLILGLSTGEPEAAKLFAELKAFVGGDAPGYICFEQPPPETSTMFLAHAQRTRNS